MAKYNKIKNIQIETSTICNAACPQCLREWYEGDHSFFKQTYIPTEFYEERIPDQIYNDLERINFCGTMGDPCAAPNFIDVCRIIKKKNPNIKLTIATNGGLRSVEWWKELASVLDRTDIVIFGIDGLENTNWIYRVNVKWNKLMENVKAFIDAGGHAWWQFIVFKHNEKQIEEARNFSQQMGFKNFFTIYNNRFFVEELFGRETFGADGKRLEPPTIEEEKSILLKLDKKSTEEWGENSEKSCIKCQSLEKDELYIDADTHLLPCCFIAGAKFTLNPTDPDGYYKLWTTYGGDKLKLSSHNWNDILNSEFYLELEKSWTKKFSEGRLIVCSGTCSVDMDAKFTLYVNKKDAKI